MRRILAFASIAILLVTVCHHRAQCSVYTNYTLAKQRSSWKIGTVPISMAFVFDRTGSMFDDLVQVRAGAARILNNTIKNGETAVQNYILVPFRDPDVGPSFQTDDPKKFLKALNKIKVLGGKDCPEMSITALKLALELCLPGSVVYVFTDAEAKDYKVLPEVIRLIKEKYIRVNFILTGNCGLDPHESLGPDTYETIATVSSGQIVNLNKSDVNKIWKFVEISINLNRRSIFSADKFPRGEHTYVVEVHEYIDQIIVTATGEEVQLTARDGEGRLVYPQVIEVEEVIKFPAIVSVLVKDPIPGNWSISVSAKGRHTLRVEAISSRWGEGGEEHKIVVIRDKDECATNTHNCRANEICENLPDGFRCVKVCPDGSERTTDGKCIDINECLRYPRICGEMKCVNLQGTYRCEIKCGRGLRRVGSSCKDINECYERPNICGDLICVNTYGSYRCQRKRCQRGFTRESEDCVDIDECAQNYRICGNRECVNTNGSYHCKMKCPNGYRRGRTDVCIDVDECMKNSEICGDRECINTKGSYRCETRCPIGYQRRARLCTDINECLEYSQICGSRGDCVNTRGSYRCEKKCQRGYEKGQDGVCTDIDECTKNSQICGAQECINTPGSYRCETRCPNGYQRRAGFCKDIDECSQNSQLCGNRDCVNSKGSYRCEIKCTAGYQKGSTGGCIDVDECTQFSTICGDQECVNIKGSYRCEAKCPKGYKKDRDGVCIDVNECVQNSKICGDRECINTKGSYHCLTKCPNGFQRGSTADCIDINECVENSNICGDRECINTPGSYRCQTKCRNGYQMARSGVCTDIDECTRNYRACGGLECVNTEGSYRCETKCPSGYQKGRDGACTDINECEQQPRRCQYNCVNTNGGFQCLCPRGFRLDTDQVTCIRIENCPIHGYGKCQYKCNPDTGRCECPTGYRLHWDQISCSDINECLTGQHACGSRECFNTLGKYHCLNVSCPSGYFLGNDGYCTKQCNYNSGSDCPGQYSSVQHNAVSIPCYLPLNTDFLQLQPHIPQTTNQQYPCHCTVHFYPIGENKQLFGLYQFGNVGRLYNRVVFDRPGFYELRLFSDYLNGYGGIVGRTMYRVFIDVSDYAF